MINSKEIKKYTQELSILFVEDHDELRIDTVEILKSFFNRVDSCVNGKEALHSYIEFEKENKCHYDIVLTDIQMPVMNGIDLTKNIYDINPKQHIIVLSAYDDSSYLLSLINLGIEQFIKKPIDYQELLLSFLNTSKKIVDNNENKEPLFIKFSKGVEYNKNTKSLVRDEKTIYLTKFEIIFLELLSLSAGKIYSNEDIVLHYKSLNESIDSNNIRKLVSKLRKKLPEKSLESIYGVGYKVITL